MTIEDQINDILSTASFADEEARLACEEKLRALLDKPKPADYAELLATLLRYQSAIVCADDDLKVGPAMCANAFEQAAAAIRSLIGERDRALTNEYIAKSNRDEMIPQFKHLLARAEAAEARLADATQEINRLMVMCGEEGIAKERAQAQLAQYEKALEEISQADPIDMVLDPQWARRIAHITLSRKEGSGPSSTAFDD